MRTDTLDIAKAPADGEDSSAGLVTLYAPEAGLPAVIVLDGPVVLGREPPAGGLALPFGSVSKEHARLAPCDEGFRVDDLGSRNGTFVNGSRVRSAVVGHGDELRLGAVVFELVERGARRALELAGSPEPPPGVSTLVGGHAMASLRAEILRVAAADLTVLVQGETGTGKEVVARAIHASSGRPGAFCAVNCAAIPAALLEAELFGAKRGAFTGLERDRVGLIRAAAGGTLLLDEIGDLPLEAQAKLLRVLDTREVTPLGTHVPEPVDVRFVSATHKPLPELVREQRFRADLYARISMHTIEVPPLRERKADIAALVRALLARQPTPLRVTPAFMIGLLRYDWPMNVRELEAAIKRAVAFAEGGVLDEAQLPPAAQAAVRDARARDQSAAPNISARSNAPPEAELRALLERSAGNVAAVARALGKDRAQIHRWLKLYGISLGSFRS